MVRSLSGNRAYVISFAVFFAVLLAGMSFVEIKRYERSTFHEETMSEIDANNVYLARQVIAGSYAKIGPGDYGSWVDAVKKYCGLEGLSCGIENQTAVVQGKNSRAEFRLLG